jgi:hypothetical protein
MTHLYKVNENKSMKKQFKEKVETSVKEYTNSEGNAHFDDDIKF